VGTQFTFRGPRTRTATADPPLVKTGGCLGDMTSELKPGFHIEEFVSGEPKNYAYRIVEPETGNLKTVFKVRGITLSKAPLTRSISTSLRPWY
jgi:hypothetical protein